MADEIMKKMAPEVVPKMLDAAQVKDPKQVVIEQKPPSRSDFRRLRRLPYRLTLREKDNLPMIRNVKTGKEELVCKSNEGIRNAILLTGFGRLTLKDGIPILPGELKRLRQIEMEGRHDEAKRAGVVAS